MRSIQTYTYIIPILTYKNIIYINMCIDCLYKHVYRLPI